MTELEEQVTELSDPSEGAEKTAGGVEESSAGAGAVAERTKGAVGLLVGILTGGFVIAAAAGFVVGLAIGVLAGRRATPPPPRWQVWR
jgi:hypothetical protein